MKNTLKYDGIPFSIYYLFIRNFERMLFLYVLCRGEYKKKHEIKIKINQKNFAFSRKKRHKWYRYTSMFVCIWNWKMSIYNIVHKHRMEFYCSSLPNLNINTNAFISFYFSIIPYFPFCHRFCFSFLLYVGFFFLFGEFSFWICVLFFLVLLWSFTSFYMK